MRSETFKKFAAAVALLFGVFASMATNLADDGEGEASDGGGEAITCAADEDCAVEGAEGPHCLQSYGLCVECLDHDGCASGERCHEFRCIDSCESSAECEGELVCKGNLCVSCQEDVDCGDPGLYCYVGAGYSGCRSLCARSVDCTGPGFESGDVCRAGRCQPVDCTVPQDCLVDQELCSTDTQRCESIQKSF